MNLASALQNLLVYSLQLTVVIGAAGALAWVFRLRVPKAALAYWHAVLAAVLLLPLLQPWRHAVLRQAPAVSVVETAVVTVTPVKPPPRLPLEEAIAAVLLAGCAARLLWILAGACRLRTYLRRGTALDATPAVEEMRERLGVRPSVCVSAELDSPATFGLLRPAVLLPRRFLNMERTLQQAIACHEFLHVRRHDWAFTIFEELVRSLLWFQPAIWWLLGRIQLSREQAVDLEVIAVTRARDHYLDALLEAANVKPALTAALAPPFLRRRHLTRRIAMILHAGSASAARLAFTLAGIGVLLIPAAVLTVRALPLQGKPVTAPAQDSQARPEVPGRIRVGANVQQHKLIHRVEPVYPPAAKQAGIEGTVRLRATIGPDGAVKSLQTISGHPLLVPAAEAAVRQWRYAPTLLNGVPVEVVADVDVRFYLRQPPPEPERDVVVGGVPGGVVGGVPGGVGSGIGRGVRGGVGAGVAGGASSGFPAAPPTPGVARIRVGGNVHRSKLIYAPAPEYPREAQQAGIRGAVLFNALIATDGTVREYQVLAGDPLLIPAAEAALKQHRYQPTLLNGMPCEVVTQVEISVPEETAPGLAAAWASSQHPDTVYRVGNGVTAPKLIHKIEPEYTQQARDNKVQGTVVLETEITPDGLTENTTVLRSLDPGLDEKAIEALRQWRFDPAMKDGKPVRVKATVEINFRLN